jgi:poly-beta-1,6-N-acetyl-D-glucosamine biosynthesis protein PgaD
LPDGASGRVALECTVSPPLIIVARHHLSWHQRLASDASTAVLWTAWLWLWSPLLQALAAMAHVGMRLTPAANAALASAAGGFERPLLALAGASGTLIAWKSLPRARRAEVPGPLTVREQARAHGLPERTLRAAQDAKVCVVHHDAHGRIVGLEPRGLEGAARRSA